jgi:tRNA (mo5U34)-methyltransferase
LTTPTATDQASRDELLAEIASRNVWYHTLELAPGVTTPGWFDLRPIVDRLPWPDVHGKRCLDVGPYDGFLAFELERRGAAEVVAADVSHPSEWDFPAATRPDAEAFMEEYSDVDPGGGLKIAKRALGSQVERVECNVYDLTPERVGMFDVVVCGSLLLHLRDPASALEAIHSVCREHFLSSEQVSAGLSLLSRKRAFAQVRAGDRVQWWIPNVAAHRKLIAAAGFEIEATARPYAIPHGVGHREHGRRTGAWPSRALTRLLTGQRGMAHAAVLARPRRLAQATSA